MLEGSPLLDLPPDLPPAQLTFAESFDDFAHGAGPWLTRFKWDGIGAFTLPGNGELQLYVDPAFTGEGETPLGLDPFSIEDGSLVISAEPAPEPLLDRLWGYRYLSGMISSRNHLEQTYGYFAIRAKLPAGQGLWTAFWLLPVEPVWPPEIDIIEVLGHEPDKLYMNLHTTIPEHRGTIEARRGPDLSQDFHEFGLAWRPDRIDWYLDGEHLLTKPTPDDMDVPMHLLMTLSVGGNWPGPPDATTVFPAMLVIDEVRVYQFDHLAEQP